MNELSIKFNTKKKTLKIKAVKINGESTKFKCKLLSSKFGSNDLSRAFSIAEIILKTIK